MDDVIEMTLSVTEPDADDHRLAVLADYLRNHLHELAVGELGAARGGVAPPGTRGTDLETIGTILVTVQSSVELVSAVITAVRGWLARGSAGTRTVKLKVGEAELELAAATPHQQDRLVNAFLAAVARENQHDRG